MQGSVTAMEPIEWWQRPLLWLFGHRPDWRDRCGRLLRRMGNRFYWVLAILFALAGASDQFVHPFYKQLSNANFDWLMRHRPVAYKPDSTLVVIDIDEASLAALATEFGRWPWPRQVLAEVAAKIEAANARAVMFDILFADLDTVNPASDRAFDRYVASSRVSFFPATRLNPQNDADSQVTVSMLNFAAQDPTVPAAEVNGQRTIALLPPDFKSIYDSTRTGTNNINPDADNVLRWYSNYEILGGYRIPSLPYRMAQVLGWPLQTRARSLLNWPRSFAPYRTISFADAYHAVTSHDDAFFRGLADKIVLIGSTAPGLNDIKATPVDHLHPGIYILATAIDNTRNNTFLRPAHPIWIWGLELLLLAASARLFSRTDRATYVAKYFVIIPVLLIAVSMLALSRSTLLIDLSVPTAVLLFYFTISGLFESNSHAFAAGTGIFAHTAQEVSTGRLQIACLPSSTPRASIESLLLQPGCPIKLWVPPKSGLGRNWAAQGWVLWRWLPPIANDSAAPENFDLQWLEVATPAAKGGGFSLAQSIVTAASIQQSELG